MNEPSVFNHFEGTVPADALHHNGFPHAHQHNLYGFYHAVAAYTGLLERNVGGLSSGASVPAAGGSTLVGLVLLKFYALSLRNDASPPHFDAR